MKNHLSTALLVAVAALLPASMAQTTTTSAAATATGSSNTTDDSQWDEILKYCWPETGDDGLVAPCVEQREIELSCLPNGTEPVYLEAHRQCICNGSFFKETLGCNKCSVVHGINSPMWEAFWSGLQSIASESFCGAATPTATWQDYIYTVESDIDSITRPVPPSIITAATTISDQLGNKTAVSLYYNPSGSRGPGVITGSAATATLVNAGDDGPSSTEEAPASSTSPNAAAARASGSGLAMVLAICALISSAFR